MTARRIVLIVLAVVVLLPLALAGGVVLLVQSEWGERWLEAQVSQRIHREVQVEDIRVKLEWPIGLTFEKIRIGNPGWAKTANLIDANGLHAQLDLSELLHKRIVLPFMSARTAEMGLEIDGDNATWKFGDAPAKDPSRIELRRVYLDDGHVVFRNDGEDTALDATVKGSLGAKGELNVEAKGKLRGEAMKASVRLPELQTDITRPIRFEGKGTIGATRVAADGIAAGKDFESLDLNLKVSGNSLKHLHKLVGVLLPETPPYRLNGHLKRTGSDWAFDPFDGRVGDSDLGGAALYRKAAPRPFLKANLRSKLLDFDDLGPLVGSPPKTGAGETSSPEQKRKAAALDTSRKVIPKTRFQTERWDDMDADVRLVANKVLRPKQLPVDSLTTHLVLRDGVVTLDPLDFGFAGGRVTSLVKLDGKQKPMNGNIKADIQGLKLARLFPTLKTMDEALGTFYGRAELKGRGNSIADLLDTSNGKLTLAASGGQVSQLLTELLEIDVAKALMLLGTRKQQVELRCAVGHLDVKDGIATPDSFIIDTSETNVNVRGNIDLGDETLNIETHAKGKSPSLVTLRSPIVMEGPFKSPKIHPKGGPIVAQAGAAAALAAVNPALAIAPFVSRGSGKDADCSTLLAEARAQGAVKKQS
jgi:uncharacterized protein involved in outer membrane biogenesis